MENITRRKFLSQSMKLGVGFSMLPLIYSCANPKVQNSLRKKIVILGIDGMDPFLLTQFVSEGVMPNFFRLIHEGGFKKMRSSIPPQSPVAWSEFSVGASASVHGIFDFIHRDPKTMIPYFSTSKVSASSKTFSIGGWEIPLSAGVVKQLREGTPFWEYLGDAGIPTTIIKMPGEFPAISKKAKSISGMGTPDIFGSYGTFAFFTSSPPDNYESISGGNVFPIKIHNNKIVAELTGPVNTLKKDAPNIKIPFVVWLDPENKVVKIKLQGNEWIMTAGEWSDWVRLSFDYIPHIKSIKGICKIYIKKIHPDFEMYVSPINIDPLDQSLPVTSPADFGQELVQNVGLFNTKGLPADTKALSYGVLSDNEYLQLSGQILEESKRLMEYELAKLKSQPSGVLFFYFSNIDQDSHMFWRAIDVNHPLYTPQLGEKYHDTIRKLYIEMDKVLGDVYKVFSLKDGHFRLIVMSDHGFAPFYRCVNLNTWLLNEGYVSMLDKGSQEKGTFFENVDWSRTKAYGLGINALYINREGRERYGIISEKEYPQYLHKLKKELLELKDSATGSNAVSNVWIGKEIYNRDDDRIPDLIIGWNRGYRASWETILGGFPQEVFVDNTDKWSGDHCIDPFWVPAVLLSNRKITLPHPTLPDVTATILTECNISIPEQMTGKPLYPA